MVVLLLLRKSLSTNKKMKETKFALGTWAWGAGAFGGDAVYGVNTNEENLNADTLLQLPLVTNLF